MPPANPQIESCEIVLGRPLTPSPHGLELVRLTVAAT